MGRLENGKPLLSYVSLYLIVMIVLTELYQISATSQATSEVDQSASDILGRDKRGHADLKLWDLLNGDMYEKANIDFSKLNKRMADLTIWDKLNGDKYDKAHKDLSDILKGGKKRSRFYRPFYNNLQ